MNKKLLFAAGLLLLHGAAHADTFEISCSELSAAPGKNLPSPYKAIWDGGKLMQIAADSNGKVSESVEKVVAAKRLSPLGSKALRYSFVTRIQEPSKNRFLTNIAIEPTAAQNDYTVSVSYATVDSDGFLMAAFEMVNEKCTLSTDTDPKTNGEQPSGPQQPPSS
ncbi:MAG: hypothetical protein JWP38_3154 [Herbaspirillum sp.]|jgi:hypothetical protein|nr:hypothetical protein [Herbaspirillum sp.]